MLPPPIMSCGIGSGGTSEGKMVARIVGEDVLLWIGDAMVGGEGMVAVRYGSVGIFCASALHAVSKSNKTTFIYCAIGVLIVIATPNQEGNEK